MEEDDDEDEFDDGWNELGISSNDKMGPDELARAEKVRKPPSFVGFRC